MIPRESSFTTAFVPAGIKKDMALVRWASTNVLRFYPRLVYSASRTTYTKAPEPQKTDSSSRASTSTDHVVKGKSSSNAIFHYAPEPKQAWVRSFQTGEKLSIVELNNLVFGARPRLDILHRVVVWQRAKRRSGTAKVKTRGEVRGGGRKPRPQKGSGRARQGSIRAPHYIGGGVVHGPRGPVSYEYTLPKKVRRMGLRTALSVKFAQGDLFIVDSLQVTNPKTRDLISLLENHGWSSALLVDGGDLDENLSRASSNLQKVDVLPSRGLNVYSILLRDTLVLSIGAVRMLEERLTQDFVDYSSTQT